MKAFTITANVDPAKEADLLQHIDGLFNAIAESAVQNVSYFVGKSVDASTFTIVLAFEGEENPFGALEAFRNFQQNLSGFLVGPPASQPLQVIGSYSSLK